MTERAVVVANALGLHARAAAKFVRLASSFDANISVKVDDGRRMDGKSIMGLLLLAAVEVLMRRPSLSMPRIMMGMAMLIPLGIIALMYSIGFVPALMTKLGNVNPGLAMLGWIVLLVVVGGMICAAGHAFIRAFQFGVEAANVNSPAASGSKAPTPAPQPRTPPATKG